MQLGQYRVSEEELQGVWGLLALISTPQSEAAQNLLSQLVTAAQTASQQLLQAQEALRQAKANHAALKPREDALKAAESRAHDLAVQAAKTKEDYENKRAQIKAIM